MDQVTEIISRHAGRPHMLLVALQEIQDSAGYIPESATVPLSVGLGVPEGEVQAVISFYSELSTTPPGRHRVRVCQGDSCAALGARDISRALEEHLGVSSARTTADGRFSYDTVYCLGNCALSPSVALDDEVYGRMTAQDMVRHLQEMAND